MNLQECIEKGFIRQDFSAQYRVENSIEIAYRFLRSAKRNLDIEEYEMAQIAAYNATFHAARALLFAKGYIERSHLCLSVAIRELYPELNDMINTFDRLRISRHNVQYGGKRVSKEEVLFAISFAEEFLKTVERTLEVM